MKPRMLGKYVWRGATNSEQWLTIAKQSKERTNNWVTLKKKKKKKRLKMKLQQLSLFINAVKTCTVFYMVITELQA